MTSLKPPAHLQDDFSCLSLSLKLTLKQCHRLDMAFLPLNSSQQPSMAPTAWSSMLPNPAEPPIHSLSHSSPLWTLYHAAWLWPQHSSSFPSFAHAVPTTWTALPATSTCGNTIVDFNTQLKCCLPNETFPNPFNWR